MKNNEFAIDVKNLEKSYGLVKAVQGISFRVARGSFFAFLGENGAGKSTTINIISTILEKDNGEVLVENHNLDFEKKEIKNDIGIVFQNSVLDQQLTVKQNLLTRTSFYALTKNEKKENINKIVKLLDLGEILDRPINHLSGGQKRRVDIARAMVHSPKLLILDEPTTGLDPKTRQIVWRLIDKIRHETHMTVFLTTHYLEEAEKADYVVVMDKGKIIAEGLPVELKNKYSRDYILSYGKDLAFEKQLKKNKEKYEYDRERNLYVIYHRKNEKLINLINRYKKYLHNFEALKGTMDDAFINITGHKNIGGEEDE